MHSFKGHTKAITGFSLCHTNENYIVTASLDGSIKIFCLEKMIEIFSFEVWSSGESGLGDNLDKVELIDDRIYAIYLKGHCNAIEIG